LADTADFAIAARSPGAVVHYRLLPVWDTLEESDFLAADQLPSCQFCKMFRPKGLLSHWTSSFATDWNLWKGFYHTASTNLPETFFQAISADF